MIDLSKFKKEKEPDYKQLREMELSSQTSEAILQNTLPSNASDDQMIYEHRQEKEDLIRWQQDMTEELSQLIYDLRGEYQDTEGNWKRDENVEVLCNAQLIAFIQTLLRSQLSKNLMMSNYGMKRILLKLNSIPSAFVDELSLNYKYYNIKKRNLSKVSLIFRTTFEPTYFRSLNDGERRHLRETSKRIETHIDNLASIGKKKSMFGFGGN